MKKKKRRGVDEVQQLLAHPALRQLGRERLPPTPAQRAADEELEREVEARCALEQSLNPALTDEEEWRRGVETLERATEYLRQMIEKYGVK